MCFFQRKESDRVVRELKFEMVLGMLPPRLDKPIILLKLSGMIIKPVKNLIVHSN